MRLDRRVVAVWALGAALAVLWVVLNLPSDDLAGATYRADLFSADGFLLWDNGWYAGHHMLAYSVLYPPAGALLSPRLLGVLATVAAVVAFQQLVTRAYGERAWIAGRWFASRRARTCSPVGSVHVRHGDRSGCRRLQRKAAGSRG